ncbi:MAG: hypothetical protein AAFY15_00035 [Cyanobacteria bacterium J06648_11]
MTARKPGNPDSGSAARAIKVSIPRGGDYLDNFDRPLSAVPPAPPEDAAPAAVGEGTSTDEPPAPDTDERVVELKPSPERASASGDEASERVAPEPAPKKAPAKKRASSSTASAPKKAKNKAKPRPRRADIGFRPELEEAADSLRKLAIAQSEEAFVNRTDVIAQATCAVARAIESIQCRQVPTRGHFASPQARIFDNALQEAFYRGVAHHYIKHNVHQIPDRLLEACYQQYRQRNGLDDDSGS